MNLLRRPLQPLLVDCPRFLSPFSASSLSYSKPSCRVRSMATNGSQFASQKQDQHPGKEHVMDPHPRPVRPAYKPANKLEGKVAIITGGDSGIGRAVAYLFSLEGATVAFTYVPGKEEKDAEETLAKLKELKGQHAKDPIKIPVDLGYEENCKKVVEQVAAAYGGRIDIVVNNAAEQHFVPSIEELEAAQIERVFRTNIFSHFYIVKFALKYMREGSCIVNTTSVNAYKGNPTLLDYTATKGAIVAFTRGLALQLVSKGIRVNAVAPGPIWTPLIPASVPDPKSTEQFGSQVPMGRAGQPDEVATAYVFLASEDASYFTGQVLHPNGGAIVNA